MSNKKTSFGRTYLISVPIIALVTLLLLILGARLWAQSDIKEADDTLNTYVDKTSVTLSSDNDPEFRDKLVNLVNGINKTELFSANVKLPDGSYLVDIPAEKHEKVDKAINDLPGLIGSKDLLGLTHYRAGVKSFESPQFKGTVTVAIVFEDQLYQIYKDESVRFLYLFIGITLTVSSGFIFGLIPAFISGRKSRKSADPASDEK